MDCKVESKEEAKARRWKNSNGCLMCPVSGKECYERKYENHRLIMSGVVLVLIGVILYLCKG